MKKNIQMPKLSAQMETGILTVWNKEPGDAVKKGDVLFEVETEKVVSEVESMASGILKEVFFEAGDEIKVDEIIAVFHCD